MNLSEIVQYCLRNTAGVRDYLRQPLNPDPVSAISLQLKDRESNWLQLVRMTVFERPDSPYSRMFRLAGCEFADLSAEVRSRGLEPTLALLRSNGVYLAHQELKGKQPIVRAGREIPSCETSFDHPFLRSGVPSRSGGSRSEGTQSVVSAACRVYREGQRVLAAREFDLHNRVDIQLKPLLPGIAGLSSVLSHARIGLVDRNSRWFSFGGPWKNSFHFRLMTHFLVALARVYGFKPPFPVSLPANDFSPVAEHIARLRSRNLASALGAFTSPAVRVAAAAREKGWDIAGTLFLVGGEPLTEAKRRLIESTGCRVYPRYHISEVGQVGYACSRMNSGNCVHLFEDSVAAINYRQKAPFTDFEDDSILFTTLLPVSPKILINADMDDAGRIEPCECDCVYGRIGLRRMISGIHSVGKLTGHGMSLAGTDVVGLLEQILPKRFGGGPTDYQLVEVDEGFQTRIILRVRPEICEDSVETIRDFFLKEVQTFYTGRLVSRVWRNAGALHVQKAAPLATRDGKVLSLHLLNLSGRRSDAA
jgi:hypothetical protein